MQDRGSKPKHLEYFLSTDDLYPGPNLTNISTPCRLVRRVF